MTNHDDKIKEILLKWENSDFRKEANENWNKIKNKVAKDEKAYHSKINTVLNILKYPFFIFGIIYFFVFLILLDQDEDVTVILSLSVIFILLGYICHSKVTLKSPKQFTLERNNKALLSGAYNKMLNNK